VDSFHATALLFPVRYSVLTTPSPSFGCTAPEDGLTPERTRPGFPDSASTMSQLKLVALDEQDLSIVSAHVQDAVLKVADLSFLAAEKRFVAAVNRFVWENRPGFLRANNERRRCALHFEAVRGVKTTGFSRDKPQDVLSLLAIRFEPGAQAPAGTIELVFSAGAAVRLDVDYIEARLADLGAAWEAASRPAHKD